MVAFLSAAAAKPLQIPLMRSDEFTQGVIVRDAATGEAHGRSRLAGLYAVSSTVATRAAYLVQPMLMPPLIVALLARRSAAVRAGGAAYIAV